MIRPTQSAVITPAPVASQDQQVMQVLTSAAQRVAEEAQSQVIGAARHEQATPDLQALAKQQHVLTVTAQAFDEGVSSQRVDGSFPSVLAAAAQQVVFQAARQVAADRSAKAPTASQVTVNDVSVATQTAVAKAVEITGPLSSEVDVLMTASSLLQQSRASSTPSQNTLDPSQLVVPDTRRHHSTGTLPRAFLSVPTDIMTTGTPIPFPSM
jgi:DNA polymerase III gamma/tau subunit